MHINFGRGLPIFGNISPLFWVVKCNNNDNNSKNDLIYGILKTNVLGRL